MRFAPHSLLIALASTLLTLGYAEPWTIQIVAFRDLQMAHETIDELRGIGFDAYHEFAMFEGNQYVRVRVGCFSDREGAEAVADGLKRHVTDEAVVVPLTLEAPVSACIHHDIGFRIPDDWGIVNSEPNGILFWVEVGERQGYIAFNGRSWQIVQTRQEAEALRGTSWLASREQPYSPLLALATDGMPVSYGAWREPDFVQAVTPEGAHLMIGRGELLWHSSHSAVIRTEDAIVAVTLVQEPR